MIFQKCIIEIIQNLQINKIIKGKKFYKIINWFILFDDYIYYIRDNSSLDDIKSFLDVNSKSLNSDNNEYNLENQSILLFRINI